MARNGNTDSGIESDPECDQTVPQVVDFETIVSQESENSSPHAFTSFQLFLASGETITTTKDTVSELERQELPEFFEGKVKGKSLESYLQIRNHFITNWLKSKPSRFSYHDLLRKISHLRLGNVTAFSRVQKFLECYRVINVDAKRKCELARESIVRRRKGKRSYVDNQMAKLGSTPVEREKLGSRTRPNPFKLVPLESYDSESQAPFAVRLSMEALAVIDVHSHCVRTEVIGLLGGIYCHKTQQLFVLTSEPCASLDDHDLQCDMDPVSQAQAKESLESKSYSCVGWYHSHPTFIPNPSLRDCETQLNFQQLFSKESGQPFIALILSPYCALNNGLVSQFKCLWVSEHTQGEYRIPYELQPIIIRREKLMFSVENKLIQLCAKVREHASKVQLTDKVKRFRGLDVSHLQKLCASLRFYLCLTGLSAVECDYMVDKCSKILLTHLVENKSIE